MMDTLSDFGYRQEQQADTLQAPTPRELRAYCRHLAVQERRQASERVELAEWERRLADAQERQAVRSLVDFSLGALTATAAALVVIGWPEVAARVASLG